MMGTMPGRGVAGSWLPQSWRAAVGAAAVVLAVPLAAGAHQADGDPAVEGRASSCLEQLQQGYEALDGGDALGALGHYRSALDSASSDSLQFQALFGLGSSYAALGNYGAAITALEHATDLAPEDAGVWYTLGSVFGAAGQPGQALEALGRAVALDPGLAAGHYDICLLETAAGRNADAAAACQRAVEADPGHVPAWIGLGVAHYHLGHAAEALAAFRETLELDPDSQRARYGLGLALLLSGDKSGAVEQYVALKDSNPELGRDLYRRIFP